jgi:hypothetical protein
MEGINPSKSQLNRETGACRERDKNRTLAEFQL